MAYRWRATPRCAPLWPEPETGANSSDVGFTQPVACAVPRPPILAGDELIVGLGLRPTFKGDFLLQPLLRFSTTP